MYNTNKIGPKTEPLNMSLQSVVYATVNVDVEVLRAQAYASMPASYIITQCLCT